MADQYFEVVVACLLEKNDAATRHNFKDEYESLLNEIRLNYDAAFRTTVESLDLRSSNRPRVIVMVTEEATTIKHVNLRVALARYVETGGTLICCCWFPSKSAVMSIDAFLWEFHCGWTVLEGLDGFVRVNLSLNTALKPTIGETSFKLLEPVYAIEAVHLQGVSDDNKVYLAGSEEENPKVAAIDPRAEGTPSAFRKCGRGFLGYVGDIGLETGTQAIIMAMIQAGAPVKPQANTQAVAGSTIVPPTNLDAPEALPPHLRPAPAKIPAIITRVPGQGQETEITAPTTTVAVPHLPIPVTSASTDDKFGDAATETQLARMDPPSPRPLASDADVAIGSDLAGALVVAGSPVPDLPALAPCNPGCAVCTILYPALRCTACRTVQYCSRECQALDWPQHKVVCGERQERARVAFAEMSLYGSD